MNNDTICALATPTGGAIALIRMSGNESKSIAGKVFNRPITEPRRALFGQILGDEGEVVDEVVLTYYQAPHSYTGEDCIEITCHGSRFVAETILQRLIEHGCRQAEPGEYTKRAFLNGKMDLSQAEAVADLIAATNRGTHRMAMSQLRGGVSGELHQLSEKLLRLTALLELELDFSDHEDLEFADRSELLRLSQTIHDAIGRLADSFKTGRAIKQGIGVAIVGHTNVGKSTLLNRLLGEERAIVSNTHGTTRDTIEETITLHGITFRFIDTAGLRQTDDEIEQIGIRRTYKMLDEAQIVIWLIDQEPSAEELHSMRARCKDKSLLIVQNKIDRIEQNETSATQAATDDKQCSPQRIKQDEVSIAQDEISAKSSNSEHTKLNEIGNTPHIIIGTTESQNESTENRTVGNLSSTANSETSHPSSAGGARHSLALQSVNSKVSHPSSALFPSAKLAISAKRGIGIDALEEAIYSAADIPEIRENDVIITSARHYEILLRAQDSIRRVISALQQNISGDLVAEDLRDTIQTLNEITGQAITPEATLQSIFSEFCIGK